MTGHNPKGEPPESVPPLTAMPTVDKDGRPLLHECADGTAIYGPQPASGPMLTIGDGEQMAAAFADWMQAKALLAYADAATAEYMARAWMAGVQWGMGLAIARAAAQKAAES